MLPLADGSLRLRTDDEDSSASEDSFFSAAEVTQVAALSQPSGLEGKHKGSRAKRILGEEDNQTQSNSPRLEGS